MDRIEVTPLKSGKWKVSGESGSFDDRSQAIAVAREKAGVRDLFDADGNRAGNTPPQATVVLMRPDGSVYGELYAPAMGGGQTVSINPVGESGSAG